MNFKSKTYRNAMLPNRYVDVVTPLHDERLGVTVSVKTAVLKGTIQPHYQSVHVHVDPSVIHRSCCGFDFMHHEYKVNGVLRALGFETK